STSFPPRRSSDLQGAPVAALPADGGADLGQRRLLVLRARGFAGQGRPRRRIQQARRGEGQRPWRAQVPLLRGLLRPGDLRAALRRQLPGPAQGSLRPAGALPRAVRKDRGLGLAGRLTQRPARAGSGALTSKIKGTTEKQRRRKGKKT